MKRYLRVYALLIQLNLKSLLIYPANFYNSLLSAFVWGFFSLYSIVLLTSHTTSVFGWKREELLLLNGVYGVLIGIFHTLFSHNFERFSSVIHTGQLDSVLLKPISSQFLLSFWRFGWTSLARIVVSAGYVAVLVQTLMLDVTLGQFGIFLLLSCISLMLLYSIWYIVITLTIWFTRLANLVVLMFNITGVARYPGTMFSQLVGYAVWFFLPFMLVINVPTKVFLAKLTSVEIIMLIGLSSVIFQGSRYFWRFALRYYTGASG